MSDALATPAALPPLPVLKSKVVAMGLQPGGATAVRRSFFYVGDREVGIDEAHAAFAAHLEARKLALEKAGLQCPK